MKSRPWLPYVAPFALYMVFLQAQNSWPNALAVLYPIKTIVVGAALWYFRNSYVELRPNFSLLAVAVGLVVIVIWIWIDPFYPHLDVLLGKSKPFDPHTLGSAARMWAFIAFRVVGAVIVVPLMEELFWRAFLIRWIVKEDFKEVPVGTFNWPSFAITVLLFGGAHNEWLAALICGALYNWLLYRRKDVFSCVVAHATSNAVLAAWVLGRGDWKFW